MAIIKCDECGNEISTKAKTCPKCGAKNIKKMNGYLATAGLILVGIVWVAAHGDIKSTTSSTPVSIVDAPAAPSCKSDWQLCADNVDLINNNNLIFAAQRSCKSSATDLAKFGTPEWPWFAFGSFLEGSDGPKTGIVRLVENEAKFQNGYGAMAHVKVKCTYDLKSKSVVDVKISE